MLDLGRGVCGNFLEDNAKMCNIFGDVMFFVSKNGALSFGSNLIVSLPSKKYDQFKKIHQRGIAVELVGFCGRMWRG